MASVAALFYPESQKKMMVANQKSEFTKLAKTIALGVELNFTVADETKSLEGIQKTLEWAGKDNNLDYIAIAADEGLGGEDLFLERYFTDTIVDLDYNDKEYIFSEADFEAGFFRGRIIVATSKRQIRAQIWELNKKVYLVIAITFGLISLAFYFLARALSSSLKVLRTSTNALINKEYETQIKIPQYSSEETRTLAKSIGSLRDSLVKEKDNNEVILSNLQQLVEKRSQSLKEAQQVAKLASFEWDVAGNRIYGVSEFFEKYTSRKISGKVQTSDEFYLTIDELMRDEVKAKLIAIVNQGGQTAIEYKLNTIGGPPVFLEVHATIKSEERAPILFGTIMDKTHQVESEKLKENFTNELKLEVEKKSEELLNSENELYHRMNTLNRVAMVSEFNMEGIITYANESFCRVLGVIETDILGSQFPDLISVKQGADTTVKIWEEIESGNIWQGELAVTTEKKDDVWLIVSIVPFFKRSGETDKYVVVSFDITYEKDLQHQLEIALNKERELGELKSRFVSMASHQFRTPLAIIQSNSELLSMLIKKESESVLKGKLVRSSERITGEISRMTQLMDDVLILGKIGAGHLKPDLKEIDLVELLKDIQAHTNETQRDGRSLDLKVTGKMAIVHLDEQLIQHVVENLVSNAFKYSEEENPKVYLNFNLKSVIISVEDKGVGIPEIEIEKLFQPFYRADNVTDIQGTGLGLVIAKEYTELNGGNIDVESIENEGTKVSISFPIRVKNPAEDAKAKIFSSL
jgi:PAS domain S-box-containing protein